MAEYGNNFTSSSNNYKQTTSGHNESASDWTIVTRPNNAKVVVSNTIDAGNNTTIYGLNEEMPSYIQTRYLEDTLGYYIVYFPFNENANTKGSISGNFSATIDSTQGTKIFQEPTSYDDTSNGYPTGITVTESLLRKGLVVKGTTDTRGYRKEQIQYTPYIEFNKDSNDDGTTTSHATVDTVSRYDAFQTFYNFPDPYATLSILSVENHDDEHSTSPIFCTITNPNTTYKINHSYTYSPYVNSATWDKDTLFKFTYNQLPTYPKQLVFTYSSNWNSVSYDGGTVNVEAKALLEGTYQGFTTSTATDTGFTTYKRCVDISYLGVVANSSTMPTGNIAGNGKAIAYTMRIWQPASELSISYTWTLPIPMATTTGEVPYYLPNGKFDLFNSKYTEQGNTTTVVFNRQDHDKGSSTGTLANYFTIDGSSCNTIELSNAAYTYPKGSVLGEVYISGVEWKAPINRTARTVTLQQNMQITNCIAQNITPKDSNGMPYKTLTLTQQGMKWNNPAFNMKLQVEQVTKDTSTYKDDYDFGYPVLVIADDNYVDGGSSYTCIYDGNEHTIYWPYPIDKKYYCAYLENKIPTPYVTSSANGNFNISPTAIEVPSYLQYTTTVGVTPNLTFTSGYTSGVSGRTWKIKNTSNVNTEEQYGTVGTFEDVTLKLDSIALTNISYSTVTITANGNRTQSSDGMPIYIDRNSVGQVTAYSYSFEGSSTWDNDRNSRTFNLTVPANEPTIGEWKVSNINVSSAGNLYGMSLTSTTKNASTRTGSLKFSASTNKLGTITCNDNASTYVGFTQPGTNISGTISYTFDVCDWRICAMQSGTTNYPIDGTISRVSLNFNFSRGIKYVTGVGSVGTSITTSSPISVSGQYIYFKHTGTPTAEADSDKSITYTFRATSNIVSEYAAGCDSDIVVQGTLLPTGPNYKYQYSRDNSTWYDYSSSGTSSIYASSNYGSTTSTAATLTTNGASDIRNGLYDYKVGSWYRYSSSSRTHTIYTRVVDTNDTSIIYYGGSASITQSGAGEASGTNTGNFTITIRGVSNCSVSPTTVTVNYSSDKSNCGSFSASPSNTSYNYSGAYSKSDTRGYDTSNVDRASATKVGSDKTYNYGDTISETYGVSGVTDTVLIRATGSRTWKVDYQYSVQASNEGSAHTQTSTFNGYDSYSSYYVYAYISFNGGSYSRYSSSNSTRTATSKGTYSVSVKWATSASGTALNSVSYSFTYDTYPLKTEYQITTCYISVSDKSYTAFDNPGSTWSVTASTSVVVQKRTSSDNGATWTTWASTNDYSASVTYAGYLSGSGTTASGSMSQGSSATDGNTKTITFTLKVTCYDNSTTKTATATSKWTWYGKTYYNS